MMKPKMKKAKLLGRLSVYIGLIGLFPVFGIIASIAAIYLAQKQKKIQPNRDATVGMILGAGGIIWSVAFVAVYVSFFAAPSSALDGTVKFNETLPALASVQYTTFDGTNLTVEESYPGLVYLFVEPFTDKRAVENVVKVKNGTIVGALPVAGLYTVRVSVGKEAYFLSSVYGQSWFLDGTPAFKVERGTVTLFDFFSGSTNPDDCYADHGDLVNLLAKQFGASTEQVDVEFHLSRVENTVIAHAAIEAAESAVSRGTLPAVFSFSLQSPVRPLSGTERASGAACNSERCKVARQMEKNFLQAFFQAMETEFKVKPYVANSVMFVIIAGNQGVNLDKEINFLKTKFPSAFRRIKIIGGSDEGGSIARNLNYLSDNSGNDMAYARGVDVPIGYPNVLTRCSGTSFAAPQVAAILEYIWRSNPSLKSYQVIDAFNKALAEQGVDGVIPQTAEGAIWVTKQAFLDRMIEIAREMAGRISPAAQAPPSSPSTSLPPPQQLPDLPGISTNVTTPNASMAVAETWKGMLSGTRPPRPYVCDGTFSTSIAATFTVDRSLVDTLRGASYSIGGPGTSGTLRITESVLKQSTGGSEYYCELFGGSSSDIPIEVSASAGRLDLEFQTPESVIEYPSYSIWHNTDPNEPSHDRLQYSFSLVATSISSTAVSGTWKDSINAEGTFTLTKQ